MKDFWSIWFRTFESLGFVCRTLELQPAKDDDLIEKAIVLDKGMCLFVLREDLPLPGFVLTGRDQYAPFERILVGNKSGEMLWLRHPLCPDASQAFAFHCKECHHPQLLTQSIGNCDSCGAPGKGRRVSETVLVRWRGIKTLQKHSRSEGAPLLSPTTADKAELSKNGHWETLRRILSESSRVHYWPTVGRVEDLIRRYPNFSEVGALVLRELRLAQNRKDPAIRLPRILLVGSPSCGKSSFADELARILVDEDYTHLDFGHQVPYFALVGSDSSFRESKMGRILALMAGGAKLGPVRNPMLILDEIDKIIENHQYSPIPALQSILDERTAKTFIDEFLCAPIDASGLLVVAIANDSRKLPGPLMSRFVEFHIADYTEQQLVDTVVPEVYRTWKSDFWEGTYPDQLSRETRQLIVASSAGIPRQFAQTLSNLAADEHPDLYPRPTFESITKENCQ